MLSMINLISIAKNEKASKAVGNYMFQLAFYKKN